MPDRIEQDFDRIFQAKDKEQVLNKDQIHSMKASRAIPPIDRVVTPRIESATFALG